MALREQLPFVVKIHTNKDILVPKFGPAEMLKNNWYVQLPLHFKKIKQSMDGKV
jgi:hypothetical protein